MEENAAQRVEALGGSAVAVIMVGRTDRIKGRVLERPESVKLFTKAGDVLLDRSCWQKSAKDDRKQQGVVLEQILSATSVRGGSKAWPKAKLGSSP